MLADLLMPIGETLKRLRAAAGMTQQEVAVKAGLSVSAVIHIEAGRVPDPRMSTLKALARALETTVDTIIAEDEPEALDQAEAEQPKKGRKGKK